MSHAAARSSSGSAVPQQRSNQPGGSAGPKQTGEQDAASIPCLPRSSRRSPAVPGLLSGSTHHAEHSTASRAAAADPGPGGMEHLPKPAAPGPAVPRCPGEGKESRRQVTGLWGAGPGHDAPWYEPRQSRLLGRRAGHRWEGRAAQGTHRCRRAWPAQLTRCNAGHCGLALLLGVETAVLPSIRPSVRPSTLPPSSPFAPRPRLGRRDTPACASAEHPLHAVPRLAVIFSIPPAFKNPCRPLSCDQAKSSVPH